MTDHAHDEDHAAAHDHPPGETRVTAPMQAFSTRQVVYGLVVLAVGVALVFLLPYFA